MWVERHAYSQTRLRVASGKAGGSVFFELAVPPWTKKFDVTLELLENLVRFACVQYRWSVESFACVDHSLRLRSADHFGTRPERATWQF
jgi:hypothetical protein